MKKIILAGAFLGLNIFAMAQTTYKVDIAPFPKPEKGMKQVVIEVPHSDQDNNKKIEIFVGKDMEVDTCNRTFLGGDFKTSELKGWGYNYLTFETKGVAGSTMMACPNPEKVMKFVSSRGYLTNYNGRMPIVLYIPEGYEAKFKIYTANDEMFSAQEIQNKTK
ncbi:ecotin [Elizabethkingia sp. JS20170427COW]|uniref:ecotin n=1 Tax=Elizabethkingia sp. JS20170427COW TaxID=2583851 RepID=UPI0011101460|nr:ecotin family protein [Elizabethkingia sp. JS20170427COW]QCX53768.1 proteinase inhibitor [Elizabethkingia sp. JS20170427COW]